MKIKFYGNSGWITPTDEHSCFSAYTNTTKILFDAGSPKILTETNVHLDAIILTHIHFDHIKNLYNLLAYMNRAGRCEHLKIYAPVDLRGKISDEIIPNADDFRKFTYEFITTLPDNIGDIEIKSVISLQKTKPYAKVFSLKLKTDKKTVTFITDVSLTEELINFSKDSDMIICDAAAINENNCGHLSPESVKKLLLKATPKKIILTHFDELKPEEFLQRINFEGAICATTNLEIDTNN
ncbi:MAG: MBL fold metallo-hydrolase [Candidatus Woesearchaeota archaeon]